MFPNQESFDITIKTLSGLEEVLMQEIEELGGKEVEVLNRAVRCKGDKEFVYRANYLLRTALRVLIPFHEFVCTDEDELYKGIYDIEWENIFELDMTFAIDSVISYSAFNHTNYVALKAKDAIVDRFRDKLDKRPNVDNSTPDIRLNIHIFRDKCTVSLDSSGDSLHKRGYREAQTIAPLNEVLAAGMLLLAGWGKEEKAFMDPMCGSGTLVVEAALIANNIASGKLRRFGFQTWNDYDRKMFNAIKEEAKNAEKEYASQIIGSDKSKDAILIAANNAKRAGLAGKIALEITKFEDQTKSDDAGIIVTNPPYGERIKDNSILDLYKMIGDKLKQEFTGYEAWMISSNVSALKNVGLKPAKKYTLFNGSLECKYHKFELYQGSRKTKYQNQ
jgi:putative N6-adenine-specific DNA methylase